MMTELKNPGAVSNGIDKTSCTHACIQMVMRTNPNTEVFSFDKINKILRRKSGYYSWGYATDEALSKKGFKVKSISTFATEQFAKDKEKYLFEYMGREAGKKQAECTDMSIVLEDAKNFLKANNIETIKEVPSLENIRSHIKEGWYAIPLVNGEKLNLKKGYYGHSLFLYGFNDKAVLFNDPGPPFEEAREETWELFEQAWSSPSKETRGVTFYKPKI